MTISALRWPHPYRWAFGITDDADGSTLESVRTVYELFLELGIRPTRALWTHRATAPSGTIGPSPPDEAPTLDDPDYLAYCEELAARGVEMAMHGASSGNNSREATLAGFDRFNEVFGRDPSLFICHRHNAENLYWGENHFRSQLARRIVRRLMRHEHYYGENEDSPYFWADICQERVRYMRLYRSRGRDILRFNPNLPYHQFDKPAVRFWFSANAQDVTWLSRVKPATLDALARRDGAIILYTHLSRYVSDGQLIPKADEVFSMLAARTDVWHAGVSSILDRCLATKNLVVQRRRHATVIANPTAIDLERFQVRTTQGPVFRANGSPLEPDADGHILIGSLPAGGCITLFDCPETARVGDAAGIPRREIGRMMYEEAKRLVWQQWRWWRGLRA